MPGGAQAMNEMMGGIMERPKHVVRGGTPHTRVGLGLGLGLGLG